MTPLARKFAAEIRQTGPLTIARYMQACLTDPVHGYYVTRDPFGTAGDFTTAPEISQMFGELIGLWLAQVWIDQGTPRFTLAELGPGRGTLMADILRATARVPGFHDALDLWLVETSPTLREAQKSRVDRPVRWVDGVADLPDGKPLFVVANEFFDALPIHQYLRLADGWRERMVGLSAEGTLTFGLASGANLDLGQRFAEAKPETVVEYGPAGESVVAAIAPTIARHGGAILAIDYGAWDGVGDTLQALRNHAYDDPLAHPGEADLTAHVGFRWLAEAATGLVPHFGEQGSFLAALGIGPRAGSLASQHPDQAEAVADALHRLTDASEMGTLFKVLALLPEGQPVPPGFAP